MTARIRTKASSSVSKILWVDLRTRRPTDKGQILGDDLSGKAFAEVNLRGAVGIGTGLSNHFSRRLVKTSRGGPKTRGTIGAANTRGTLLATLS